MPPEPRIVTEHTITLRSESFATDLSQQAFRKRQNAYIQELEKRMEQAGKSDDERIAALEEENRRLRRQLVSFINKLESAHVALQSLSVAMNKALG